jgi:hypothetical protein
MNIGIKLAYIMLPTFPAGTAVTPSCIPSEFVSTYSWYIVGWDNSGYQRSGIFRNDKIDCIEGNKSNKGFTATLLYI